MNDGKTLPAHAEPSTSSAPPAPRWTAPHLLAGVFVAIVLALVYLRGVDGPWLWDDHNLIEGSPVVTEGADWRRYFLEPLWTLDTGTEEPRTFYRPLVVLSYRADWLLHHGSSAGFHLTNVAAFAACIVLAHAWFLRLRVNPWASALALALWGASPHLVESVGWIAGRTDVLATLFSLGALVAWPAASASPAAEARGLALAVTLLGAALLSKENALATCAVLVVHALRSSSSNALRARRTLPIALLVAAYLALRTLALRAATSPVFVAHRSFDPRRTLAALGTYASMLLDPRPASFHGSADVFPAWAIAFGVLFALGAAAFAVRAARTHQAFALVMLATLGLAPVLHVVPLPVDVLVADRFLFLPALAIVGLAAFYASRLPSRIARPLAGTAIIALALQFPLFQRRIDQHRNELAFWLEAERSRSHETAAPLIEVGRLLHAAHRYESVQRVFGALLDRNVLRKKERMTVLHNVALGELALGDAKAARRTTETLRTEYPGTVAGALLSADVHVAAQDFVAARGDLETLPIAAREAASVKAAFERVASAAEHWPAVANPDGDTIHQWSRARYATAFLGARVAEASWVSLVARPDAPREAVVEAVAQLAEVGRPRAIGRALEVLRARDGESETVRAASAVLQQIEARFRETDAVIATLRVEETAPSHR